MSTFTSLRSSARRAVVNASSRVAANRAARVGGVVPALAARSFSEKSSYEKDVTPMQGKVSQVNLYDGHYSDHMAAAQSKVRIHTYGEGGESPFGVTAGTRVVFAFCDSRSLSVSAVLHAGVHLQCSTPTQGSRDTLWNV
eukprot:2800003-Rhodomonas_salina.3